jgi:isochorismate synthase EntC
MSWCDEEFFTLGAYQADVDSGKILLGKGGEVQSTDSIPAGDGFFLKQFYTREYLIYRPREILLIDRQELLQGLGPVPSASFVSLSTEDETYEQDFQELMRSLGLSLEKVVLVSRESFKASDPGKARRSVFARSLTFASGTPYGLWHGDRGIVGSTPEVLYSIEAGKLRTFALAGTAPKGQEEELLASEKDRHEHDLVVRDIEEKLAPFATEIETGAIATVPFAKLIHLKTSIEARLRPSVDLASLTNGLSPTAALGGYPTSRALAFLQRTKYAAKFPQRTFGSAFGLTQGARTQALVMIRNVQWDQTAFYIESGGGVVRESLLENELAEIHLKRAVIRGHYL